MSVYNTLKTSYIYNNCIYVYRYMFCKIYNMQKYINIVCEPRHFNGGTDFPIDAFTAFWGPPGTRSAPARHAPAQRPPLSGRRPLQTLEVKGILRWRNPR